jgi:two-component system chemotaxis response regulator CheB
MSPQARTRILIVDDSAVMRSLLRAVVATDSGLEVAGTAADGQSALQAMTTLHPDLVLLDVEMPIMDGLETLKKLRAGGNRAPVIICSSLTQRGARVTLDALASGASDYAAKPAAQSDREAGIRELAQELIPKIRALTQRTFTEEARNRELQRAAPASAVGGRAVEVVAIGVSTGGPAALDRVLGALPGSFPVPVLIVQHMPELFTGLLAERLNSCCRLPVREASEGNAVRPGSVWIARGNWHMEVRAPADSTAAPTIHLTQSPAVNHCRPSVDVLFGSLAAVYGESVLAVILTGMGSDGLAGCRKLRSAGSMVIAQDQATSTVWGMPGAVTAAGLANRVLRLDAIGPEIVRLAGRSTREAATAAPGSVA